MVTLLLLLLPLSLLSQVVFIYDSSGAEILHYEADKLVENAENQTFVTVIGNTVFDGNSREKKDILLLITTESIFSRKRIGYALNAAQDDAIFTIADGKFFVRETKGQMAHFRKNVDGYLLYKDTSGVVLCSIPTALPTGKLVAVFYYFMRTLELERLVKAEIAEPVKPLLPDVTHTSGSISRLWSTGLDEFVWDGEVFKRKWNSYDFEEWTFDGTTLKRLWFPGNEEFLWDGRILRRKWFQSYDEFEWDGTILRRRYGSDEFIIQGNIVKRYFGNNSEDEWQIDGEVPIPLIALVVFGLLGK